MTLNPISCNPNFPIYCHALNIKPLMLLRNGISFIEFYHHFFSNHKKII